MAPLDEAITKGYYIGMALKVSAGSLKGRKIKSPPTDTLSTHGDLRPTSGRIRESAFDILSTSIKEAVFLDLYAGTGAIGVEAISRGAKTVYFIDADKGRAGAIADTLNGCGCRESAIIVNSTARDFLNRSATEGKVFDIVYLDPPYASDELMLALGLLGELPVIAPGAWVIAEHPTGNAMPREAGELALKKTYCYGGKSLTVYRRPE